MDLYHQKVHGVVTEVLSELVEATSQNLEAIALSEDINSHTTDNRDIEHFVESLVDQVVTRIDANVSSFSNKNALKNANRSILPDVKWSTLGISQTGRIMDPICLQKNIFSSIAADQLVEYQWPPGNSGDYYMLQEQVSTFLNITSFKRKYPAIERRKLDPAEVNHLLSAHVISEVQVTLGLTALRSSDVCDLLVKEYPDKYVEYSNVVQEREKQKMRNKYKQYATSANTSADKSQVNLKRAINQAAAYNAHINKQRREEFAVYYDMSTNVLQYPKRKVRKVDPSLTRPSLYPCALIPGQYQEYYHRYTKDELMYLPLNTALYGPPQPPVSIPDGNLSNSESDSGPDSDASVTSVPRSVKSVSSAKVKQKLAKALQKIETPATINAAQTDDSNSSIKPAAESESKQETTDIEMEDPDRITCGICLKDETSNKKGNPEDLIKCSQCDNHGHPSCLEMSSELVEVIKTYDWQCMECKTCTICSMPHREDLMMFCDRCDRGYHTFCVSLRTIPSGVWACSRCTYADPDFVKRKRKQIRASLSPGASGRGRGRRRRHQRRTDTPRPVSNLTRFRDETNADEISTPASDSVKDQSSLVKEDELKTENSESVKTKPTPISQRDPDPIIPEPISTNEDSPVVTIKPSTTDTDKE